MKNIASMLATYQHKEETKKSAYEFQDYVAQVIKDFGIVSPYDKGLWRIAKKNLSFLKGKVESLREKAKYNKEDTKEYGRLLTWSLKQRN